MAADGGAPRGAIVLAADEKALGIVRSLGRRGIRVLVLRDGSELAATASRHAWRRASWRAGSADERVDALLELASRRGLEDFALFPTKDETLALVASHADRLSTCFRLTRPRGRCCASPTTSARCTVPPRPQASRRRRRGSRPAAASWRRCRAGSPSW